MELAKNKRGGRRERRRRVPSRKKIMCKGPEMGKHTEQSRNFTQTRVSETPKGSRTQCEMGLAREAETRQTSLVIVITGVGKID